MTKTLACYRTEFYYSFYFYRTFKDDREQIYNLHCISPEGYKNNTVVISERFRCSPKEIFNDIYQRFLSEPRTMRQEK